MRSIENSVMARAETVMLLQRANIKFFEVLLKQVHRFSSFLRQLHQV